MFEGKKFNSLRFGSKQKILTEILNREVLLTHFHRGIPRFADGWLATMRSPRSTDMTLILSEESLGDIDDLTDKYLRRIGRSVNIDIVNWLTSDITDHIRTFFSATGAQVVSFRLSQEGIKKLHHEIYEGHLKLICNYGPENFLWVKNLNQESSPSMRIEPLDIVLLKGKKWPGREEEPFSFIVMNPTETNSSLLVEIEYLG